MSNFASFQQAFKGDIVTPSDPDYPAAVARWALNAQRNAQIIAFVKDAEDVALAIKYARDNKLSLAVRGGGHSPGGSSSTEGLVVDLSRHINGVTIDAENKLAIVGGGAVWETVDKAAIKHELATVGGTVNHTGVGGLTLGGGYGWLSAMHGLTIDNLVKATIVTANGSILTVSESENPDLWFAIRGGGSNFGVCTEFVYRLHYQRPRVFSGMAIFTPDVLDKGLIDVTNKWIDKGLDEKEAMMQVHTQGPDGHPIIVIFFFYNGPTEEGRTVFKPFFDLKPVMDATGELPYEEVNALQNNFTYHGQGAYIKGVYHTRPQINSIRQSFERSNQLAADNEFTFALIYEYFSLKKITSVPNGKAAFFRRPHGNMGAVAYWKTNTPENIEYARKSCHELADIVSEGQVDIHRERTGYGNFESDADKTAVLSNDKSKSLFRDNYPRLQELKKKYDPDVMFSKWFVVLPAE